MGNSQIARPFHHETKGRQIPKILLYNALQSYQFTARLSVYRQVLTLNFVFTVHWSTKRESGVTNYLNMDISKRSVNLATFIASFLAVLITNTPPISSDYIELRNNARLSRPPYWTSWQTTADSHVLVASGNLIPLVVRRRLVYGLCGNPLVLMSNVRV